MTRRLNFVGQPCECAPRVAAARAISPRAASMPNWSWLAVFSLAAAAAVLLVASPVSGNEVKGLGFYPPFESFNARGERTISSFTLGGASVAKQSFARITPDMTDNQGSMFSRLTGRFNQGNAGPAGGQFSLAMQFRVSGAVEKAHGKHLAVVIGSPDMIRRKGGTYGLPYNFVGVGIVISPRPPADMSEPSAEPLRATGPRQFVSFFANNGTRTTEDVRMLANSCASTIRYYEGRDDFNFLRSSRVRLGYYDGAVTLEVDARNIGTWRKCITTTVPDMPEGWLDRAGVVITAQTGVEVSNNHDVMSLELYTERDEAFNKKLVDGAVDRAGEEEGVTDEEAAEAARTERLYAIRAHLEHEFDAVERLLKASLAKLANVNDDIAKRITKVEKEISMQVFSVLNTRVKGIEDRVKTNAAPALETRIKTAQDEFQEEIRESMEALLGDGTGWRLPFVLVFGIVAALFTAAVKQYRRLLRSNFLGGMR